MFVFKAQNSHTLISKTNRCQKHTLEISQRKTGLSVGKKQLLGGGCFAQMVDRWRLPLFLKWPENKVGYTIHNQPYGYTELYRFSYKMDLHTRIRFQIQTLVLAVKAHACYVNTPEAKAGDCCVLEACLGFGVRQTKETNKPLRCQHISLTNFMVECSQNM